MTASRLFEELPDHPIVTVASAMKLLEITKPTASKAVGLLEDLGILTELTGRLRDRTFGYGPYLEILRADEEAGA